jgi:hypothetical protein
MRKIFPGRAVSPRRRPSPPDRRSRPPSRQEEARLDSALADTFPASDPVAMLMPAPADRPHGRAAMPRKGH